jgi:4'-phosphopantetheinyl transferase
MIRCFITDCSPLEDPKLYARAYSLLSDERKEKADFYVFGKDRRLSAVAGLYIRLLERSYGKVYADEHGKLHSPGIEFNLSHSGHYVAFACSVDPVGIDIEEIGQNMDIARKVMTVQEYEDFIGSVDEKDREDVFARMWTAKESYMKALGLGFRLPPETFRVLYGYDIKNPAESISIYELEAPQGYHVSACSPDTSACMEPMGADRLMSADSIEQLFCHIDH